MYSLGLCAGASIITLVEIKQNGTKSIVNKVLSRMHEGNPEQVIKDLLSGVDLASYNSAAITGRRYKEFIKLPNISEPLAVEYAFKHVNGTGSPYNAIISTGAGKHLWYIIEQNLYSIKQVLRTLQLIRYVKLRVLGTM